MLATIMDNHEIWVNEIGNEFNTKQEDPELGSGSHLL